MSPIEIQYWGHATLLLKIDGVTLLVDPVFSQKVLWFRRHKPLPINPEMLPPIDAILLTHVHFDHLDFPSYRYIPSSVPIIIPAGSANAAKRFLENPLIELTAWSSHTIGDKVTLHPVPMKHCGGRIPFSFRYRNTFGYVLTAKDGETIYLCGDTAYGNHFRDVAKTHSINCALLPIGGYKPLCLFRRIHMHPREALQAAEDLGAKIMIPIHWGVFQFSLETLNEPLQELKKCLREEPKWEEKVKILQPGESYTV